MIRICKYQISLNLVFSIELKDQEGFVFLCDLRKEGRGVGKTITLPVPIPDEERKLT